MSELQPLQAQLMELQMQLTFQEDLLQTLDNIVVAQQSRIEQLELSNVRLQQQITELLACFDQQRRADLPPHY